MFQFIKKKISYKIMFAMFLLMSISSVIVIYLTVSRIKKDNIETTQANLEMLSTSMFQTLRNAMNTGDPAIIAKVEQEEKSIEGVQNLQVAKGKPLLALYDPSKPFTTDKDILKAFQTKKAQILEITAKENHSLRMLKPMIASQECIACHYNQSVGDVIGVIDLTFSLKKSDEQLNTIIWDTLTSSTILGWFTIAIIFFIIRKITEPIEGLKKGFENLLASHDVHEELKLDVKTEDEIGQVSLLFNQYMDKLKEDLEADAQSYTNSIMNTQKNLILTSVNGVIETSNQAFLNFFNVKSVDEFKESYGYCVSDTFVPTDNDEYLNAKVDKQKWNEYIATHKEKLHKVLIKQNDVEHIFSVSGDKFLFLDHEIYTAAFSDITEVERIRKEVEAAHKHTRDSIEYASLIQNALIPLDGAMDPYFKDNFVLWMPKDTVGGDIWLFEDLRHEDECLMMFIDCTGHGVPGAFVTMIVKAVEREIVSIIKSNPNMEVSPAWILGYFNRTIKQLLRQETKDSISNAGFDGGIIYYNRQQQVLKFAGAETPLFYIDEDGELKIVKGNRYSVGYKKCAMDYEYKETILQVKEGMKFYCTTDGFLDQNGGTKDFPFGKKRFGNIIKANYTLPMKEQKEVFIKTMKEYESIMEENHDRNDDMTVIGFEIAAKSTNETKASKEIVKYEGVMTQNVIAMLMDNIEAKVEDVNLVGHISTIAIEYCQNMMHYAQSPDVDATEIVPAGEIEIQHMHQEYYEITARNVISKEGVLRVKPRLEEIQTLDHSEIKKRYRELRRSGKNTHQRGGGIGMYEIAKASTKIEYDFIQINENKYYFVMKSFIESKTKKSKKQNLE